MTTQLNWFLLFSSLLMVGCFSTFKYVPVKDYNSSVTYNDGFETLSSVKINEISLSKNNFFNTRSSRIAFNLKVRNNTAKPFNFTYNDINIFHVSAGNRTKLSLFTFDYLISEEESSYRGAQAWNSLESIAELSSARNAGYKTTNTYGSGGSYSSYNANAYGNDGNYLNFSGSGNTVNYGSSTSQTYDAGVAHAARQAALAENRRREQEALANHKRKIKVLRNKVMRNKTIEPYMSHGGIIQFKTPRRIRNGDYILFSFNAGNEYHTLRFNLVEN